MKIKYIGDCKEVKVRLHLKTWRELLFKKDEVKEIDDELAERILKSNDFKIASSKKSEKIEEKKEENE